MKLSKTFKSTLLTAAIIALGVSAGCSSTGSSKDTAGSACAPTDAYKNAVAEANAALDKAASVGGEWRDSRWKKSSFVTYTTKDGKKVKASFMGAAEVAAENCDFESAMKYLETAKFQGEMGYEQAMEQKTAGPKL